MPILSLATSTDIGDLEQANISRRLSELTSQLLGKNKEVTIVNIAPSYGSWFGVDGRMNGSIYQLSICITTGTNTVDEIALWLEEAWSCLKKELGVSEDAICYTSVVNIDGAHWGFNGVSQLARKNTSISIK